jgi:hypothetical protein
MKENETIKLSRPWLIVHLPFVAKVFRTTRWSAYRGDKLIALGKAFNFEEGERLAKKALYSR